MFWVGKKFREPVLDDVPIDYKHLLVDSDMEIHSD